MAPGINPKDVVLEDPDDFQYVSIKNWLRKKRVLTGNDKLANFIGKPGPITGFVIGIADVLVTFIVKFSINMFTICTYAFNWMYNLIFGTFDGIIPSSYSGGTVVSMKYFRYFITALMPPFGILLSKGLYGWFSIIVCIVITYVNYMAGIIYAFVITARNRYSDQYEKYRLKVENSKQDNQSLAGFVKDSNALLGTCGFVTLLGFVFYLFLSFF